MRPLRIGFVGYGAIGKVHAMGYRMIPHLYGLPANTVQITAVATSRPATAQVAQDELGCAFATHDYRALLARSDVDVVDVCVTNDLHLEVVEAAAAAGKAIYCEKPLALTVAEGQRMVAAVEAAGVPAQMTFHFRFFPAISRAQELVASGFLGRVFSFHGRYFRSSYIDPNKPISWKQLPEKTGGGALVDIGSHILDLLYAVLGQEYASVQA
ncbi:MAG: Gfo/Idh/MocA family protein, partial [Caldilineaceae bacterium]